MKSSLWIQSISSTKLLIICKQAENCSSNPSNTSPSNLLYIPLCTWTNVVHKDVCSNCHITVAVAVAVSAFIDLMMSCSIISNYIVWRWFWQLNWWTQMPNNHLLSFVLSLEFEMQLTLMKDFCIVRTL